MERPILTVHAQVKLQGENTLRPVVLCRERTEYQLLGFTQPVVKLIDYRPASLQALAAKFDTGKDSDFLLHFNLPARVMLWASYPREIRIELSDTSQGSPAYVFWIALDPQPARPLYPFIFRHSTNLDGAGCLHLSIYQRFQAQEKNIPAFSTAA